MEINGVNVKNMTNDEINSFIKQLYKSKTQDLGGGQGRSHTRISIRTLSSAEDAFDENEKYYKFLKITLVDNCYGFGEGRNYIFFKRISLDSQKM